MEDLSFSKPRTGLRPGSSPGFAGETNIRKTWFFAVIPAEAGIQDDLKKMKSSLDNFGLINKYRTKEFYEKRKISL